MTSNKFLLGWLIVGTRGGVKRAEIFRASRDTPQNANQLATAPKVDYKTARYSESSGEKPNSYFRGGQYSATFSLSQAIKEN